MEKIGVFKKLEKFFFSQLPFQDENDQKVFFFLIIFFSKQ